MNRRRSSGARLLNNSGFILLGLVFSLPLLWQFFTRLKTFNRPKEMSTYRDYVPYFLALLQKEGFSLEMAKLIVAQAGFETGNFTSVIFKENNNLFGMKLPRIRKTTAIGENRGHAVYKSWEDCIKDYWLYSKALGYLSHYSNVVNFVRALVQKKYFEAKPEDYQRGVETYYKKYFG
jgi:hypothetical protein